MLRLARPMVGTEPDARGSPNDADVLSRFWFSSRSHSGSLPFHLRVGQQAKDDREHPIHLAGVTANYPCADQGGRHVDMVVGADHRGRVVLVFGVMRRRR
jgi:hypothetical protein